MSILYLLIPLGLILLGVAIWAFFWAVRGGQFDDMDTPAWSVVMDDDEQPDARPRRRRVAAAGAEADEDADGPPRDG